MEQGLSKKCEGESADTFLGRMEAQCSHIRRYRREVMRREGRRLRYDEAALEWIERYAEDFARDQPAPGPTQE